MELSVQDRQFLDKFNREFGNNGEITLYTRGRNNASISAIEDSLSDKNRIKYREYKTESQRQVMRNSRSRNKKRALLTRKYLIDKYGQAFETATGTLRKMIEADGKLYNSRLTTRQIDRVRLADLAQ